MSPRLHRLGETGRRWFRWLSGELPESLELHLVDHDGAVIDRVRLGVVSCRFVSEFTEGWGAEPLVIRVPTEGAPRLGPGEN
jgi:hypothetical protein